MLINKKKISFINSNAANFTLRLHVFKNRPLLYNHKRQGILEVTKDGSQLFVMTIDSLILKKLKIISKFCCSYSLERNLYKQHITRGSLSLLFRVSPPQQQDCSERKSILPFIGKTKSQKMHFAVNGF